jgi:hypothetical protein
MSQLKRKRQSPPGAGGPPAAGTVARRTVCCEGLGVMERLQKLREKGALLDITVRTGGGTTIHAHKSVLAASSPVMEAMLLDGLAETTSGEIDLSTLGDGLVVAAIVNSCYSGTIQLTIETLGPTLVAADYLAIDPIQAAAVGYCRSILGPSTALQLLPILASLQGTARRNRVDCAALHTECLAVIHRQFELCLVARSAWVALPTDLVELVLGSDDLIASEEAVLSAVRVWIKHAADAETSLLRLLPLVRLPLLPDHLQVSLFTDPLMQLLLRSSDEGMALGLRLLKECSVGFKTSADAKDCPRLSPRSDGGPKGASMAARHQLAEAACIVVSGHVYPWCDGVYEPYDVDYGWPRFRQRVQSQREWLFERTALDTDLQSSKEACFLYYYEAESEWRFHNDLSRAYNEDAFFGKTGYKPNAIARIRSRDGLLPEGTQVWSCCSRFTHKVLELTDPVTGNYYRGACRCVDWQPSYCSTSKGTLRLHQVSVTLHKRNAEVMTPLGAVDPSTLFAKQACFPQRALDDY